MTTDLPTIPGYRLLRQLGSGGMAVVYLAIQEALNREVALKLLTVSKDGSDRTLRRFLHEAKTLARLPHRNVVSVFDVRTSPPMMVMEYLAGGTLAERMKSGLSLGEVVSYISQIALGLSFAHRAGVVHRDVKPPNIMFREPQLAVITDFGIAKEQSQEQHLTQTGQIIGTTAYMSPEQLGTSEVDGRSDQYSLGIVLYELLAGRRPFVGANFLEVATQHTTRTPDPLTGSAAAFDRIVQRMLAKAPEQRFPDCAAVVDALRTLARTEPALEAQLGLQAGDPSAEQLRQLGFAPTTGTHSRAIGQASPVLKPTSLDETATGSVASTPRSASGQGSLHQLVNMLASDTFDLQLLQVATELVHQAGSGAGMEVKFQLLAAIARGCTELDQIEPLRAMEGLIAQLAERFPDWRELAQLRESCRVRISELETAARRRLQAGAQYDAALAALRIHRLLPPEPDNALGCLQQALALDPTHNGARVLLGKLPEAVELMAERLHHNSHHEQALGLLKAGLEAFPNNENLSELRRMLEQELRMQALERERDARLLDLASAVGTGSGPALTDSILGLIELNEGARSAPSGQQLLSVVSERLDSLAKLGNIVQIDALVSALSSLSVMAEVPQLRLFPARLQARRQTLQEQARLAAERAEQKSHEAARRRELEAQAAAERARQAAAAAQAHQVLQAQLRKLATLPADLPMRSSTEMAPDLDSLPESARPQLWAVLDREGFPGATLTALTDGRLSPEALQGWLIALDKAAVSAVTLLPLRNALHQHVQHQLRTVLDSVQPWISTSAAPGALARSVAGALRHCMACGVAPPPAAMLIEALRGALATARETLASCRRLETLLAACRESLPEEARPGLEPFAIELQQQIGQLEAAEQAALAKRLQQAAEQALQSELADSRRSLPTGSLQTAAWRTALQQLTRLLTRDSSHPATLETLEQLHQQLLRDIEGADESDLRAVSEIQPLWNALPAPARDLAGCIEAAHVARKATLDRAAINAHRQAWLNRFLAAPSEGLLTELQHDSRLSGSFPEWLPAEQRRFDASVRQFVRALLEQDTLATAEAVCGRLSALGTHSDLADLESDLLQLIADTRARIIARQRRAHWPRSLDKLRGSLSAGNPKMLRFLFRTGLFLIGFAAGFALPWAWYLNQLIDDRFELTSTDLPSQIYARPLWLREGQVLKAEQLAVELAAARYSSGEPDRPSRYQQTGAEWRIHTRDFTFPDGHQHGRVIGFRIEQGRLRQLRDATNQPLREIRLDPARIGSLYGDNDAERQPLPLSQMPPVLIMGLQAVEDRNFAHHLGIDQGASTLTQQLVRFTLLSRSQTLEHKLKEIGLALLLEQRYSKAEILDAYLNRAILGQNGNRSIQGFPAAAEFWFARPLGELDTGEIALLIGMLKATSDFNPRRRPEAATQRRNVVLNVFRDTGLIAAEVSERYKAAPLGVVPPPPSRSLHPGYLDLVQRELRQLADDVSLQREGLSILTALDPWAQHLAERSLRDTLQQIDRDGAVQGAVLVTRADDGRIVAAVPSRQAREVGFNRLSDARRPVGSLLKPFVYLLALNRPQRYGLSTMLLDAPFDYPIAGSASWKPKNYDGRAHGPVALVDALSQSLNLATARLGLEIGVDQLAGLMGAYGVPVPAPVRPSLILGSIDLSPLQVATLYQALAAGGQPMPLSTVDSVLLPDGRVYALPAVPTPRPPDRPMGLLLLAMNETTQRGTASGARAVQIDSAGKTGTTDGQRDSWYAGFTGEHLAVVWLGRDDNEQTRFTGASGALKVWTAIFRDLPSEPLRARISEGYQWGWFGNDASCGNGRWMPYIGQTPPGSHDCSAALIGSY